MYKGLILLAGATIQIILFASIAIELKRRAPNAHTFLEAVKARYGPITHGVYIVFSIFTNILGEIIFMA
jgi:Na+/proline symporter